MWEVILGALLCFAYAVFFPTSFNRLRDKSLKFIGHEKCDDDKKKKRYFD